VSREQVESELSESEMQYMNCLAERIKTTPTILYGYAVLLYEMKAKAATAKTLSLQPLLLIALRLRSI
jgi:hypothetical protein